MRRRPPYLGGALKSLLLSVLKLFTKTPTPTLLCRICNDFVTASADDLKDHLRACVVSTVEKAAAAPQQTEKHEATTPKFEDTDVGQGKGCKSFTGLHLDVIEQTDGVWLARCPNWNIQAYGSTDLKAITLLWGYLKEHSFLADSDR